MVKQKNTRVSKFVEEHPGKAIPLIYYLLDEVTDFFLSYEKEVMKRESLPREEIKKALESNMLNGYPFLDLSNYRPELGEKACVNFLTVEESIERDL